MRKFWISLLATPVTISPPYLKLGLSFTGYINVNGFDVNEIKSKP